ncbi:hypothetical protein EZJ19_06755 [Parasulfuritortus cantonensis]|uniref:DsrE/DsrF-like family protein n=1 Tax=Parasulfuritortus cantonensis TaxID=2528202 RepID=A0A4R1BEM5_9PROT|nr:DsrE family protein [Parasulfuritortus cantonensis]TCJ15524.1 hypothetical protein EZJ19_06755 [Parasulfuritortus cantonensis]
MNWLLAPLLALGLLFSPAMAAAEPFDDSDALHGLKEGKGLFLIDFADPRKTAFYLDIIKGTYQGMRRQRVKPDFVIVYIGPTVRFLTRRPEAELEMEQGDTLKAIADNVEALRQLGIRQEICSIATRVFHVDNGTVLPGLKLIGDGFISVIGYQSQGYKLVPLY